MKYNFYYVFSIFWLLIFLILLLVDMGKLIVPILVFFIIVYTHDITQNRHTLLRNFPIIGHLRYFFEFIRPEVRQYFIASDTEELPFNRDIRTAIYKRAKNIKAVQPFGTDINLYAKGAEWVLHSLAPCVVKNIDKVTVGDKNCVKPYMASRLNISAMSFGALSGNAIIALNKGAKLGGFYHNTGEGGLSKYHQKSGGDLVLQIGTGYFGCRDTNGNFSSSAFAEKACLDQVKMIEIKLSQGAKPSHGGILPAKKLTAEIAQIRMVDMGQDVISPPAHTAFSSPIELLQFIQQLRELSGSKPIGFKLCVGKLTEFMSICKAMLEVDIFPDFITVDGAEGGTGAAPVEFANFIGLPLNEGLHFVNNVLRGCGIRKHIRIVCSGKIASGFDMVRIMSLGADICNVARPMMMALGCLQSRQCHANTCPVGIATQNLRYSQNLLIDSKASRVQYFHRNTLRNYMEILGAMGLENSQEINSTLIMRRVSNDTVKSYHHIYPLLAENCLLDGGISSEWQELWNCASAYSFA